MRIDDSPIAHDCSAHACRPAPLHLSTLSLSPFRGSYWVCTSSLMQSRIPRKSLVWNVTITIIGVARYSRPLQLKRVIPFLFLSYPIYVYYSIAASFLPTWWVLTFFLSLFRTLSYFPLLTLEFFSWSTVGRDCIKEEHSIVIISSAHAHTYTCNTLPRIDPVFSRGISFTGNFSLRK